MIVATAAQAEGVLQVRGYKMAGDAARMRVVVNFDRDPDFRWFLMKGPHRLVIDMPGAGFFVDPADAEPRGMVTAVNYGNLGPDRSRIILSFDGPFAVERLDRLGRRLRQGDGRAGRDHGLDPHHAQGRQAGQARRPRRTPLPRRG
jgi:hypothetical protein